MSEGIHFFGDIGREEVLSAEWLYYVLERRKEEGATSTVLKINSYGGNVKEALSMVEVIKSSELNIEAHVVGIAASSATFVAMACDKVVMAPYALMMVHLPANMVGGTSKDLRRSADTMDKVTEGIITMYEEKSGLERSFIKQLMEEETWMSANEAVEYGFADEVESMEQGVSNIAEAISNYYQTSSNSENMSEQEKKNLEAKLKEERQKKEELQNQLEELQNKAKEEADARATALVASAVENGVIAEEEQPKWEALAKADFDNVQSVLSSMKTAPAPVPSISQSKNNPTREGWTIRDWEMKDPSGLKKLKNEQPDVYQNLFNEYYKK